MNRRFFVALLLVGLVIMVTPLVFRRPPLPPAGTPAAGDSTGAAGGAPPTIVGTDPPVLAEPERTVGATKGDTIVVRTDRVVYTLSTLGASLLGTELPDHVLLGADSANVQLGRPGNALLRFRVIAGADTLALDQTAFSREAAADGRGETFRATVRGIPVTLHWSFAPDTYRVEVDGRDQPVGYVARMDLRAEGLGPGSYLMVELPHGLRTSEADPRTDYQHMAYAYRRASGGADLVRFGKPRPGEVQIRPGPLTWAIAKSKYFMVGVLAPDSTRAFAELQVAGVAKTQREATEGRAVVLQPIRNGTAAVEVYAGPQEWRRMVAMGREFENANPYGGWLQGMIQPFATLVMLILLWMRDALGWSYGVILILFGVCIRIVLWPLNQKAMRSSLKMQVVQPELAEIQKKFCKSSTFTFNTLRKLS